MFKKIQQLGFNGQRTFRIQIMRIRKTSMSIETKNISRYLFITKSCFILRTSTSDNFSEFSFFSPYSTVMDSFLVELTILSFIFFILSGLNGHCSNGIYPFSFLQYSQSTFQCSLLQRTFGSPIIIVSALARVRATLNL